MREMNRRELGFGLSAFAALAGLVAEGQTRTIDAVLPHSEIFPFDALTPKQNASGTTTRNVISGKLITGEFVEVHETMLPAGMSPHAPHRHLHSEFLMIREGRLEVVSDGRTGVVGVGGVIYTASNVLHGLKNIGDTPANYFVIGIGGQQAID